MLPHPLIDFEKQRYSQHESKFNDIYFRNNLPKIKDEAYVRNIDGFKLLRTHWIVIDFKNDNLKCFGSWTCSQRD